MIERVHIGLGLIWSRDVAVTYIPDAPSSFLGIKMSRCITCFHQSVGISADLCCVVSSPTMLHKPNMCMKTGGWKCTTCLFYSFSRLFSGSTSFLSCSLYTPPPFSLSRSWQSILSLLLHHSHFGRVPKGRKSKMYYPWTRNWFWSFAIKP